MTRRSFTKPVPEHHAPALGFRVWHVQGPLSMPTAHTHSDVEVNFLLSGKISYLHGGVLTSVEPLRFTVFWGGIPHWIKSHGDNQQGIWMTLPPTWLLEWQLPRNLAARLFAGEAVCASENIMDLPLLKRWVTDFESGSDVGRRTMLLEIQARFHRLALETRAGRGQVPRKKNVPQASLTHLERITNYIARHYQEPLSVDEIAAKVGLHGKYLIRLFKRQSGMGVGEYLARLRLSHAQRLLLTTDMKIVDLALEAGFGSLGPFYRAFAAYSTGIKRPLDYRRKLGSTSA